MRFKAGQATSVLKADKLLSFKSRPNYQSFKVGHTTSVPKDLEEVCFIKLSSVPGTHFAFHYSSGCSSLSAGPWDVLRIPSGLWDIDRRLIPREEVCTTPAPRDIRRISLHLRMMYVHSLDGLRCSLHTPGIQQVVCTILRYSTHCAKWGIRTYRRSGCATLLLESTHEEWVI